MTQLRYAVIGTGAIGGYYGARLQQAGCDVHFLLRSDYETVKQQGLTVDSTDGDFTLSQVSAYRDPATMPPVDVAIVALKTTHNHRLSELLPPLKPNGVILSLQNGLGVEAAIARQLTKTRSQPAQSTDRFTDITIPTLLGGLCFICSNKIGPGHIRHLNYGRVLLGAHELNQQQQEPTALMQTIAADFSRANIPVELTHDLPMGRWRKLVWNVPYNGLSVVLNATTTEMMADSGVRSLIVSLMTEVVTAANAWGEHISPNRQRQVPDNIIDKMLAHTETMAPYRTSMKIDYDEKRPLEIEAILGHPIQTADELGVPVPHMRFLYQQLCFLDKRHQSHEG